MTTRTVINPHFISSQGGYSRDAAVEVYDRMQAKSAVCVNDVDLARMILARGGVPVLRMGAPEDDDLDARGIPPTEYADAMHNALLVAEAGITGAHLKGVAHIGNEIGSAAIPRTITFFEAVVRRLTFHQRKCCVLNLAVRNKFDPFTPLIPAVRENGGEFGFHEGLYIDPETGEAIDTLVKALATGAIGGYRRFMREYGIRARVTEFAASKSPLIGYNGWIGTDAYAKLCDDTARFIYAPDGVEFHPYSAFKWDRGEGFEYRDNMVLLKRFAEINAAYEVKEPQVTQPGWANHNWGTRIDGSTARVTAPINVRALPDETSADVGDLKDNTPISYWDKPYQSTTGGKYVWYKVLDGIVERYVAQVSGLTFEAPVAPPAPLGKLLTPAKEAELRAHLAAITAILDSAEAVAAPPAPTFSAVA